MPSIKEITLTIAWILLGTSLSNTTGNSLDPAPGRSPGPPNVFTEPKKTTPTFTDDQFSDINYSHEVEADRRTNTILTTLIPPPAQLKQQQVNLYMMTTSETMTGTATITTKEKLAVGDTPIVTLQHTSSSSSAATSSLSTSPLQHHRSPPPCNKKKHDKQIQNDSEFIKADDKIVRISNDDTGDAVQLDVMHDVFDTTPTTTNLVAGIVYKGKCTPLYLQTKI